MENKIMTLQEKQRTSKNGMMARHNDIRDDDHLLGS